MIVLTIRTDKPDAEIGLFDGEKQLAYESWQAHRRLAETIHKKIAEILKTNQKALEAVEGIVCFKGPGSFTGLRIGLTVGNVLGYSLDVPVVGATGEDWKSDGIRKLLRGERDKVTLPEYGAEAHITVQKK